MQGRYRLFCAAAFLFWCRNREEKWKDKPYNDKNKLASTLDVEIYLNPDLQNGQHEV